MLKGNLAGLMKQAQQMQENMKKMQEQLALIEVEGQSGAGLVKVTMTCRNEVRRVAIDPSLLADDKDMLEDLVAAAFNDAVRKDFPVKKVTASHSKGTCVILSEEPLDEAKLRDTIDATGYTLLDIQSQSYEKKGGLAGLFHRK